jgi:hypothetical protein
MNIRRYTAELGEDQQFVCGCIGLVHDNRILWLAVFFNSCFELKFGDEITQ